MPRWNTLYIWLLSAIQSDTDALHSCFNQMLANAKVNKNTKFEININIGDRCAMPKHKNVYFWYTFLRRLFCVWQLNLPGDRLCTTVLQPYYICDTRHHNETYERLCNIELEHGQISKGTHKRVDYESETGTEPEIELWKLEQTEKRQNGVQNLFTIRLRNCFRNLFSSKT